MSAGERVSGSAHRGEAARDVPSAAIWRPSESARGTATHNQPGAPGVDALRTHTDVLCVRSAVVLANPLVRLRWSLAASCYSCAGVRRCDADEFGGNRLGWPSLIAGIGSAYDDLAHTLLPLGLGVSLATVSTTGTLRTSLMSALLDFHHRGVTDRHSLHRLTPRCSEPRRKDARYRHHSSTNS
jgi:hypothetical protein